MYKIELLKSVRLYAKRTGVIRARKYYDEDLVSKVECGTYKDQFIVAGEVISESLYNTYNTEICIDMNSKAISEFRCTCKDFDREVNMYGRRLYACKHIVAMSYRAIDILNAELKKQTTLSKSEFILKKLDTRFNEKKKVRLELSRLACNYTCFVAEFKIGEGKMYSLKNLVDFIRAVENNYTIEYGKEFTFDPGNQFFSKRDKNVINFIRGMFDIEGFSMNRSFSAYVSSNVLKGKYLKIPKSKIGEFLKMYLGEKIDFEYNGLTYKQVEVVKEELPLLFSVIDKNEEIEIKSGNDFPEDVSGCGELYLSGYKLYLPNSGKYDQYKLIYEAFNEEHNLIFKKSSLESVVTKLVPILEQVTDNVKIDKKIRDRIVNEKLKTEFYLDRNKGIILRVKFKYGDNTVEQNSTTDNPFLIIRDLEMEDKITDAVYNLGFNKIDNKYVLKGDGEYEFVTDGVKKLIEMGEVFYSDRFRNNKIHRMESIKANIKKTERGYLDFTFNVADVSDSEMKNILKAFKENRKYYQLKNEDFIDFEDDEVRDFFTLIEHLSINSKVKNGKVEVPNNKAFYLENYIDDNDIDYITGIEDIKEITKKVREINTMDFTVPKELNAKLRSYQVTGFKWLKTLASLGFGGILGDEMGLGKTIQTIAFILSQNAKNTLIVAPTSLVYNWKTEIEKFAPELKTAVVVSNKLRRESILKNKDKYDVIITSYNLLRRDIDEYKGLKFDIFIIDEAQNIKNPASQGAAAVKSIDADIKFALTGTPIENSLIELWSIFDFIMPGYLYSKSIFNENFEKKINKGETLDELNRHIKPFILRRYKKDVIKELPDKIEKQIVVEMTDRQKKVYASYVKDVKEKLENHIKNDDMKNNRIEILSCLTRLRQLCLDPSVVIDGYRGGSGKVEALIEILNDSINEGHRILVFSQFTTVLKNIASRLSKECISYCYLDGSIKSEERIKLVDKFNNKEYSVFLISLKAGGTGLNLTTADTVIHFDPWWNPAVEDQATDRAHRFGQKHVVEVIKLVASGSIEEKIVKLQMEKKELISKVLGDQLQDSDTLLKLTDDDIAKLFDIVQ
ncbi:DEAD/DEAH box helicase [Inconstantimicrobium porci]|uniref:DEAD/DEAH box helicase n=1 Tax=Inconstantimicrobium porci TaxID=2652291 RepID=A0A7X2N0L4_9CLOT|nr:DEAD/DEAH box helicase [Inconstantimicrobium porci]MSR92557.1 DEAD/DEAH box helicase [Inconstantimicrobium porci]